MKLTPDESERYKRHLMLPEIGIEGQTRLKDAKVLVIGAGGLGCPVLCYLAAAGIGKIGIVDFDKIEKSNLQRQILYTEADCGKYKAEIAARKVLALNSNTQCEYFVTKINSNNYPEILREWHIVIDGTDNFETRYLINDACVVLGKPLIAASIFKFTGQLSIYNVCSEGETSASYRCLFPIPPPPDIRPSCAEIGVLGVLPGILGCLQANECLKLILGIGEPLIGKLFLIDVLSLETSIFTYKANKETISMTKVLPDSEYASFCNPSGTEDEIDIKDFVELQSAGENFYLLDVRSETEHHADNLGGKCIPLNILPFQAEGLPKDQRIVVYCKSGIRSKTACGKLRELGFTDVISLQGGISAYRSLVSS